MFRVCEMNSDYWKFNKIVSINGISWNLCDMHVINMLMRKMIKIPLKLEFECYKIHDKLWCWNTYFRLIWHFCLWMRKIGKQKVYLNNSKYVETTFTTPEVQNYHFAHGDDFFGLIYKNYYGFVFMSILWLHNLFLNLKIIYT